MLKEMTCKRPVAWKILMKSKQRTGLVFTGGKEEELESC